MLFFVLLFSLNLAKRENCHILEDPENRLLSKHGDMINGAVFSIYSYTHMQLHTTKPQPLIYFRIYDKCSSRMLYMKAVQALIIEGDISQAENNCNKHEMIPCKNGNEDISQLRYEAHTHNARSAVAHSLHSLLKCTEKQSCEKARTVQSWQVGECLKEVIYTPHEVWFEDNGAIPVKHDVVNLQRGFDGKLQCKAIVYYDDSLSRAQVFYVKTEFISWTGESIEKPGCVCSESCPPCTTKAPQKGSPACCYDCIPCAEGEISNQTDSNNCEQCPGEFRSNAERDKYVKESKVIDLLSFRKVIGIILVFFPLFGAKCTVLVDILFIIKNGTPIVKVNNSEMSFLVLFSLTLCFLCSLTFTGQPSRWSCMLCHTAFGINFVFCISCVLGKTIVVLVAFRVTLPGNNGHCSTKQCIPVGS